MILGWSLWLSCRGSFIFYVVIRWMISWNSFPLWISEVCIWISIWCFTESEIISIVLGFLVLMVILLLLLTFESSYLSLVIFLTFWNTLIIIISISWFKFIWINICKLGSIKIIWILSLATIISSFTTWLIS